MTRESVMPTPIFDQLLREMAQRAEPPAAAPQQQEQPQAGGAEQAVGTVPRRRHRAE